MAASCWLTSRRSQVSATRRADKPNLASLQSATMWWLGSHMAQSLTKEKELKRVFKEALSEVLDERKDLLREIVEEAVENAALARAIDEGRRTRKASRKQIFSILEPRR